jgi:hypothetical protein
MGRPVGSYHPNDNHLALNNTCSTVANFRDRPETQGAFNKISPANGTKKLPRNVTLTWTGLSGVARYEYCYDKKNNNKCDKIWTSTTGTSRTIERLSTATVYYWQVRAVMTDGRVIYPDNGAWWWFKTKR